MALTAPRLRVDAQLGTPIDILLEAAHSESLIRQMVVEFEYHNAIVRVAPDTDIRKLRQELPEGHLAGPMWGASYGADLDYSVDLPNQEDPETKRIGRLLLSAFDLTDEDVDRIWEGLPGVEFTDADKKRLIESVVRTFGLKPPPAEV